MKEPSLKQALVKLLDILEHARKRPEMYFGPGEIDPECVDCWLHGLRLGLNLFESQPFNCYLESEAAFTRRGIADERAISHKDIMLERGHPPGEIARLLLEVAEEVYREKLAKLEQPQGDS
jgi:hypothetical protein